MDFLAEMADLHVLLWIVPLFLSILVAAIGSRLSRKWLAVLSIAGVGWPLVQAAAAAIFLLWGAPGGYSNRFDFDWLTGGGLFSMAFELDRTGVWAMLVGSVVGLAAQIHGLYSVSRYAGRHLFHSLVILSAGAGAMLFTAYSPLAMLIGWEGLALSGAFLSGLWASEQRGVRTGMRWLLFQHSSSVLLLMGFLALDTDPGLGGVLVVAAACLRAGQIPFHGWIPYSTYGPGAATALVHGLGSSLAAVFLIDRFGFLMGEFAYLPEVIGIVGISGVAFGALACAQQQEPDRILGWLFMIYTGLAFVGFAVGDNAAARILVTGEALALGGMALAVGGLSERWLTREVAGSGTHGLRRRRIFLVLALAGILPPSVSFLGLGRLLHSIPGTTVGITFQVIVIVSFVVVGWALQRLHHALAGEPGARTASTSGIMDAMPAALGALTFALGLAGIFFVGKFVVGGWAGAGYAGMAAGAALLGWLLGWLLARRRLSARPGRLTYAQRTMNRIAETGLGIGEILVQLPVMIIRTLGVVVWRGIGDFLLDTLIIGTAVKTVEGTGLTLRLIHNGRIQRYTLVVVLAALLLIIIMLR
jgi:NADH:ubiquinone oxidoreductase subunit 5 (subunit L)/multisubunit Na+/H+ antiporter MnhA subunit